MSQRASSSPLYPVSTLQRTALRESTHLSDCAPGSSPHSGNPRESVGCELGEFPSTEPHPDDDSDIIKPTTTSGIRRTVSLLLGSIRSSGASDAMSGPGDARPDGRISSEKD